MEYRRPIHLPSALMRPLIIGASMSADQTAMSPGKKLALRFTLLEDIRKFTYPGTAGRNIVKDLDFSKFEDRTCIIAFDLFFWDSLFLDPTESLEAIWILVEESRHLRVPLFLGDIPGLLPGRQPTRERLNVEIHRVCEKDLFCRYLPLDFLYSELLRRRLMEYRGEYYSKWDLLPDGIHLSDVASDYLSEEFEKLFEGSVDDPVFERDSWE